MNAPVDRRPGGSRLSRRIEIDHGGWAGWRRALLTQLAYLGGSFDRQAPPRLEEVRRLVFVCLGNLNRSPFGAGVAQRLGLSAVSIGLRAAEGMSTSTRTRRCAAGFGVDLAAHQPTDISEFDLMPGDLLMAMEASHAHDLSSRGVPQAQLAMLGRWSAPQRLHLEDPQGRCDDYLLSCFVLIHSAVLRLADDLQEAGAPCIAAAR